MEANGVQKRVLGLGDPVMDVLAGVSHHFLATITSEPGGCFAVSPQEMSDLLEKASTQSELKRIPGGSAANVMKGLANVSHGVLSCAFVGMVGRDDTAAEYRSKLAAQHVEPVLLESDSGAPSACALCLVTPDGQRTMRTCLGASLELRSAQQLPQGWSLSLSLLHCEGYCLYRPQFTREVMEAARAAGALVSLDLASFELVRGCKAALLDLLSAGCVDLVFANEEEAAVLAGEMGLGGADHDSRVEAAQEFLLQHIQVSVVSMGPRGCKARSRDGQRGEAPAPVVRVVDTIGAGDTFSAGFMYAYLQGASMAQCCAAGCEAGAAAVQSQGADLSRDTWAALQQAIDAILAPPAAAAPATAVAPPADADQASDLAPTADVAPAVDAAAAGAAEVQSEVRGGTCEAAAAAGGEESIAVIHASSRQQEGARLESVDGLTLLASSVAESVTACKRWCCKQLGSLGLVPLVAAGAACAAYALHKGRS